jgi:high-affinity iron transporter
MAQRILEGVWETSSDGSTYFSIPVFFVLLRETVEVVLIVAVTYNYLSTNELTQYKKYATAGVLLGVLVDLLIGGIMIAVFVTIKSNAFDSASDSEKVFEGTLLLFSCIIVTVFGLGMSKMFNNMNAKVVKKVATISQTLTTVSAAKETTDELPQLTDDEGLTIPDTEEETKKKEAKIAWGILSVTFFAVVREGLECVVFLAGLTSSYPPQSMPIPAIAGVITGCFLGLMFYRGGRQMGIRVFALISMTMLFLVAAGLIARAFTEFVELGMDGGPIVYDASECCGTNTPFWGFLRIIFGYNATPTLIEFLIYFSYWIVLAAVGEYFGVWSTFSTPEKVPEEKEKENDTVDEIPMVSSAL